MRFHLSPEQHAIQETVRGTLAEVWPLDRLHGFSESGTDFDRESWQALMALGLGGLMVPEAHGGAGLGLLDAALVSETLGEAAAPGPFIAQILAAYAVHSSAGTSAGAMLDDIVTGNKVIALALGRDRSGKQAMSDETVLVVSAGAADFFLVGARGGGLSLVAAGDVVAIEPFDSTDRSRPLSRVRFGATQGIELFAPGDSRADALADAALVLIAADALGGAARVVEMSIAYAKEREQFGQPIGRFQGLKHQLADMALAVEPARALVWYAGYAHDAGLADAPRAAAMAKAHLCDLYVRTTREAIAAHGGIGYTWEYGLNYWFRRSVANRALLGSPATHRARAALMAGW